MFGEKETPEQKRERQTTEIYIAIGRYVEAFEYLVHNIRLGCLMLTSSTALQQNLMNAIFSHRSMSADALFRIFQSLVGTILHAKESPIGEAERNVIEPVLRQFDRDFQRAMETRNTYLHGTWFIGWGNKDTSDWSEPGFIKLKSTSKGAVALEGPKSAKEIEAVIDECKRLSVYISSLSAFLIMDLVYGRKDTVARNFEPIDVGGNKFWVVKKKPEKKKPAAEG